MSYPFDVPGYVQGFIFDTNPLHYDSASKTFLDQSPYGQQFPLNNLLITTGTPSFTSATDGVEGMILDNTVQGEFVPTIPWEGAVVTVMKPNMGANGSLYPVIFGVTAAVASNGNIRLVRATVSDYAHRVITYGGIVSLGSSGNDGATKVVARSLDQVAGNGYYTPDGVTVTTVTPAAANTGNALALGYCGTPDPTAFKARFGNISGTLGDVALSSNTMIMFEMHFWSGNPLVDNLSALKTFMDTLKAKHGL